METRTPPLRLIKTESTTLPSDTLHQGVGDGKDGVDVKTAKIRQKPLLQFLNQYCDSIDQEIAKLLDL